MADARVLIIITIMVLVIYVETTALSGKGLFCRDPDTGKLHQVNTTWSSTSFCGNYTCKQRRINTTKTQYVPIREFNVTNTISHNKHENRTEKVETMEPKLDPDIKSRTNEDIESNNGTNTNDDRYLTEKEIQTITEILHTVKKSDLDTIVDIYNLAQEIYNEMDKEPDQNAIDEAVKNVKEKLEDVHTKFNDNNIKGVNNIKPSSYWYDWKARAENAEMDTQTTNLVPTIAPKLKKDVPIYFNGALTQSDFGKIPYYYPISSFQRMATYVHQPIQPTKPAIVEKPPCQQKQTASKAHVNPKDSQKLIKPSYLLPYPFAYVHNYNVSKYQNMYYSNPWVWDYYYRNRQSNPYFKAYIAHIPNAVLINPQISEGVQDVEQKPIEKPTKFADKMFEKDTKPNWKTEPLSTKVLNEIKANIDTSQLIKAFPLRKKVKVEKVGKVIKMDEIMRHKREVEDKMQEKGEFEAYIERMTCEQKTEPGFFRYGNLTQPFPHCCPQLILNR